MLSAGDLPPEHLAPGLADGDVTHATACVHPTRLRTGDYVPCGTCPGCRGVARKRRINELVTELAGPEPSYFLSPTYTQDALIAHDMVEPAEPRRTGLAGLTPIQEKRVTALRDKLADKREEQAALGGRPHEQAMEQYANHPDALEFEPYRRCVLETQIRYLRRYIGDLVAACLQPLPERATIKREELSYWRDRAIKELRRRTADSRLPYKNRAKRICAYLRARARRPGGVGKEIAARQCQRVRDRCRADAARAHPLPEIRLIGKMEYGDEGYRPHAHAILVKPAPGVLEAVVAAWGWEKHCAPRPGGRGHVDVEPVTDAKVMQYMGREMNRSLEAEDRKWTANGKERPFFAWPRPALGTGDWPCYLRQRYADLKAQTGDDPLHLELAIQDTRYRSHSLRHRTSNVTPKGAKDRNGLTVREQRTDYVAAPPAVWNAFIKELVEPERDACPTRMAYKDAVAEMLSARNRESDAKHLPEVRKSNLRHRISQYELWRRKVAEKKKPFPLQAERDQTAMRQLLATLTGGVSITGVVPDPALIPEDGFRSTSKPNDFKEQPNGLGILRGNQVLHHD